MVLCLASLVYYAYWRVSYLPILLISIFGNYTLGVILSGSLSEFPKRVVLICGILTNLAALGFYKYADFFIENLASVLPFNIDSLNVVLPLAISFFTFQQIAYLVDASRGEVKDYKFVHYLLFVTFFPQLIAGPIVHHKEMLPQFMRRSVSLINAPLLWLGVIQFCIGLFKKVVLADTMALHATPVFLAADQGLAITFTESWIGALAYTFQLYFDFSGYSDMALGLGKMFGIVLPMNFNSPYKSASISEFWRRWHMTLSRFLRDYLYIALGGNRKGTFRRQLNLFVTMVLGGLWHGASWNFVVWGALHGVYLVINHSWRQLIVRYGGTWVDGKIYYILSFALTFLAVVGAWVLFRAETFQGAIAMYMAAIDISSFAISELPTVTQPLLAMALIALCAVISFASPNVHEILERVTRNMETRPDGTAVAMGYRLALPAMIAFVFVVSIASMSRVSEFLYFQF